MKQKIFSSGILSKEGNDYLIHGRSRKVKRMDTINEYEQMEKNDPSERAKRWFRRPAYTIRGDTIGTGKNREREEEKIPKRV